LIRPSFTEFKDKADAPRKSGGGPAKRPIPPDQTNAENFYYVKQMQSKTQMVITLKDGEVIKGVIEWYDRSCLKLNREGDPNLLLYKHNIKYMFKDEDAT
jgi:host factor-I protein